MLLHRKNERREASSKSRDAIRRIRRGRLRLTLEAEQKLRAHEDAANRQLEARLESRPLLAPSRYRASGI